MAAHRGDTGHVCPDDVSCARCKVGPVNWRGRGTGKCLHCGQRAGWREGTHRIGSNSCETCYKSIQARYIDRNCLAEPCTHRVAVKL